MNVVITGASKGIGKAICLLLAKKKVNVSFCARGQEGIDQLLNELKQTNPDGHYYAQSVDVSDKAQLLAFGDFCTSKMGNIDILINNAGIFTPGNITEEEDGALEKLIETNLYSAYHLTRKIVPAMVANNSGHVINMCSIASITALPNGGSYSISKYAMMGFSTVLREELKEKNIKVTSILPGATWSNSWVGVDLPESRLMQADDIAKTVWNTIELSKSAVVEEVIIRPQLGDL